MLKIRNLHVDKGGKTICRAEELDVSRGEHVGVIGPNGSGKTTLLRVLAGLEREYAGECRVDAPMRGRVYVHQAPYLFRGSVLFNAAYGLAARRVPRRKRLVAAHEWLDKLNVGHLALRPAAGLSGGERRRVALVRAFAVGADVLLLDEPFADLDQDGIDVVCRAIASVSSTVLLSSPVALPDGLPMRRYDLAQ